jgi:hypothetical protein
MDSVNLKYNVSDLNSIYKYETTNFYNYDKNYKGKYRNVLIRIFVNLYDNFLEKGINYYIGLFNDVRNEILNNKYTYNNDYIKLLNMYANEENVIIAETNNKNRNYYTPLHAFVGNNEKAWLDFLDDNDEDYTDMLNDLDKWNQILTNIANKKTNDWLLYQISLPTFFRDYDKVYIKETNIYLIDNKNTKFNITANY